MHQRDGVWKINYGTGLEVGFQWPAKWLQGQHPHPHIVLAANHLSARLTSPLLLCLLCTQRP